MTGLAKMDTAFAGNTMVHDRSSPLRIVGESQRKNDSAFIDIHSPSVVYPVVHHQPVAQPSESTQRPTDLTSSSSDQGRQDMQLQRNSQAMSRILHSPSDPTLSILRDECQGHSQGHERSKSMSYLSSILTDKFKLEAYRNLQRRSVEPEVFIFPSRPYIPLPNSGHVNTGFASSNSNVTKQDAAPPKPSRLSRISSSRETSICLGDGHVTSPVHDGISHHLLYGGKDAQATVKIDYEKIFAAPAKATPHYEKQPRPKSMRSMSIGEKALRNIVRQMSRNKLDYQPPRTLYDDGVPPPRNYFDLALFTCCCCMSPLGLIALFFAVRTDTAYEDGAVTKSERYSHVSLLLSLLGIGMTLCVSLIVLLTKFYVYDDVVREGLRMGSGGT